MIKDEQEKEALAKATEMGIEEAKKAANQKNAKPDEQPAAPPPRR